MRTIVKALSTLVTKLVAGSPSGLHTDTDGNLWVAGLDVLTHPPSAPVTYVLPNAGVLPLSGGTATDPQANPITRPSWANMVTLECAYTAGVGATNSSARVTVYLGVTSTSVLLPCNDGNGGGGTVAGFGAPGGIIPMTLSVAGATRLGLSCNDSDPAVGGTLVVRVVWHRG